VADVQHSTACNPVVEIEPALIAAAPAPAPGPSAPAAAARRRGTLLVVDDEDGPREALRIIFKDDYHVLTAPDGPTGIRLAQNHAIDVAVLDVRMSGMSGIEVLERLKYVDPSIEAVMMTAFETTETMRQALRLRACDYINKPFDLATMRAAVAGAMQRRTLEGEVHNNVEKLQQLLADLQNQKVEEQMVRTRGEIYASIIHDINGPLTVISGFVQLLNQRIAQADRLETAEVELVRDRLKVIARQVTNCIEISRRYLSFLRKPSGETPGVGVNQLLTDLTQIVRVHPSRQNHQFSVAPPAGDIGVRMNATDLIQVLLNLTVNAFQAGTKAHSVKIDCAVMNQGLELAAIKDGLHDRWINIENFENVAPLLRVSVCDTGPGIPPEILPKIFQAYFSTKGEHQGTGLGLNIVQRLVKEAKGVLHAHSEVGQGTTFNLYFPAAALKPAAAAPPPHPM
jgi:two-component system, sensor histidine kinase and response regulator